jgi:Periplasmic binding protein
MISVPSRRQPLSGNNQFFKKALMKKIIIIYFVLPVTLLIILSSCSTSRKAQRNVASTPVVTLKPVAKDTAEKEVVHVTRAAFNVPEFAREIKKENYNIAILSPLYLDSVVSDSFLFQGKTMPGYFVPGLEFYEGAHLAIDSLQSLGYHLTVHVYDTKSATDPIENILQNGQLDSTDLIIGVLNYQELQQVANFSKTHKINLISATYPNDGGIKDDPFFIIVNSTLEIHCKAIMQYALTNFNNINLVVFSQKDVNGNIISGYLKKAYNELNGSQEIPLHEVLYDTSWTAADFSKYLNPKQNNICIVTTLNTPTALNITGKLATLTSTYEINVLGMPTWDGIYQFYNTSYYSLPIFYSTPYYNDKKDAASRYLISNFTRLYNLPFPSDMAFKGFDITYHFLTLMHEFGIYFNARLTDPATHLITRYNFQPVYLEKNEAQPDYFENMHLYFVKIYEGNAYSAGNE